MNKYKDQINVTSPEKPKRRRWWAWAIGIVLLLALCDDDDDKKRRYCYTFGEDTRLCFQKPLPTDQDCYLEADEKVRCYDRK